jgi:hypothetical protein
VKQTAKRQAGILPTALLCAAFFYQPEKIILKKSLHN